jgi:plastocyanin
MTRSRISGGALALSAMLFAGACGDDARPASPDPAPAEAPIANVYILAGAVDLGPFAFGDHPLTIFKGERMRWRNVDSVEHNLVADTPALKDFVTTGPFPPGSERSFLMTTPGTTTIHCTIHPQMVGTIIVQSR